MKDILQQRLSILVVEDDPGDFGLIRSHARLAGLVHAGDQESLVWAQTLRDGIAAASQNKPDLVLLDLSLPDSIGIATISAISAACPGLPIVVLTGNDDDEQAVAALLAGAQDYLIKGRFDHHALGSAARHALVRKRLEKSLAESQQRLELALSGADLGLWDWTIASGQLILNERSCQMLGYTQAEVLPHIDSWVERLHPGDHAAVHETLEEHLAGRSTSYETEYRIRHKSGHWLWVLDRGKVVERDPAGRAVRAAGTHINITPRKLAERKLQEGEARLRAVLASALDGVVSIDASGRLVDFNPAAENIFGWKREEVLGQTMGDLLVPQQHRSAHQKGLERFVQTREAHLMNRRVEMTALRRDGTEFPVELTLTAIRQNDEDLFTAFVRDITERHRAEDELRIAAAAFESQEGIFVTDSNNRILRVNHAFTDITGYAAEEVVGEEPAVLNSGRHDAEFFARMWQSIQSTGQWQGEVWNRRRNGEIFPEWLIVTAVKRSDGTVTHYVGTLTDITLRKAAEDEMKNLAFYDSLTQLPNRRLLIDRLQLALAMSARTRKFGAVLFLDLDRFKTLNDSFGHDKGDLLLQQVAKRLVACVREGDTTARLGGDEFVLVLEDIGSDAQEAMANIEAVGSKILASLNQPYDLAGLVHHSTPSIGAAVFGETRETPETVLKRADAAMYQAKAAGRNTLRFSDNATPVSDS